MAVKPNRKQRYWKYVWFGVAVTFAIMLGVVMGCFTYNFFLVKKSIYIYQTGTRVKAICTSTVRVGSRYGVFYDYQDADGTKYHGFAYSFISDEDAMKFLGKEVEIVIDGKGGSVRYTAEPPSNKGNIIGLGITGSVTGALLVFIVIEGVRIAKLRRATKKIEKAEYKVKWL